MLRGRIQRKCWPEGQIEDGGVIRTKGRIAKECHMTKLRDCSLVQRIKPLCGFGVFGIAGPNNLCFSGFEGLFGGNSVEPAVMGKLFVVREIEAHKQADV